MLQVTATLPGESRKFTCCIFIFFLCFLPLFIFLSRQVICRHKQQLHSTPGRTVRPKNYEMGIRRIVIPYLARSSTLGRIGWASIKIHGHVPKPRKKYHGLPTMRLHHDVFLFVCLFVCLFLFFCFVFVCFVFVCLFVLFVVFFLFCFVLFCFCFVLFCFFAYRC